MTRFKEILNIFANNRVLRLGALTLITGSLAVPALAAANACTPGAVVPPATNCPSGSIAYGECDCQGWSQSSGWYGCYIVQGCAA